MEADCCGEGAAGPPGAAPQPGSPACSYACTTEPGGGHTTRGSKGACLGLCWSLHGSGGANAGQPPALPLHHHRTEQDVPSSPFLYSTHSSTALPPSSAGHRNIPPLLVFRSGRRAERAPQAGFASQGAAAVPGLFTTRFKGALLLMAVKREVLDPGGWRACGDSELWL